MIYTVVLIAVVCVLSTNASPALVKMPTQMAEKVKVIGSQCIKETGAPSDSVEKTLPWNLPDSDTNEKYLFCLCKTLNLVDDRGYFNHDNTMKIFVNVDKKEDIEKAFSECNALNAKDQYETTYKIVDCFFNKAPISLSL